MIPIVIPLNLGLDSLGTSIYIHMTFDATSRYVRHVNIYLDIEDLSTKP